MTLQAKDPKFQEFVNAVCGYCELHDKFRLEAHYKVQTSSVSGITLDTGITCLAVVIHSVQGIADLYYFLGVCSEQLADADISMGKTPDLLFNNGIVYWMGVQIAES